MFGCSSSRPDPSSRRSTCTIMRSPALNAPSSQSASPEPVGKFVQPHADAILDHRQALRCQGLSRSMSMAIERSTIGGSTVLSAANIHVIARARAFASSGSSPAWRSRDMEHDRPRLEEGEIAFFIGRNLPERMKRAMRGLLHRFERNKTNVVRLAHLFKRPANAHVARQAPAAIGRASKAVMVGRMGRLLVMM